jgi:ribonuclease HII
MGNFSFFTYNFSLKMALLPYFDGERIEAGLDEAGRGCLAGPVFAAAVILPIDFENDLLNDSKLLTEKNRNSLREIIENQALAWAVASCDAREIDEHNIANASYIAMNRAVAKLKIKPEFLIVDGKYFKTTDTIPFKPIIKGDSKYAAIAAASILAKTYRDEYMKNLAPQYPHYFWDINKGYPTKQHRAGIEKYGDCEHHRQSFRLLADAPLAIKKKTAKPKLKK